jgi:hypothetical protein
MPWTRNFPTPIILKDGRSIATLNQARELILSIPPLQRETFLWRHIAKTLDEAAASDSAAVADQASGQALRPNYSYCTVAETGVEIKRGVRGR